LRSHTRGWKESRRLLAQFATAWEGRPLADIGKLDGIVARGAPIAANRAFAQLRKMCAWAVSRGIIERSPCEGISPPSAEKSRDRVLSLDELRLVWRGADSLGFPFGPIVKLLILSGQRRSEVGGMEWSELDLENRLWTIPAARSKNRRQHDVPLAPQAAEIIKSLPRFSDSKFVFSPGKTAPSGFSRAKERLDQIIARENGEAIPPWVLHDIRRSVASVRPELVDELAESMPYRSTGYTSRGSQGAIAGALKASLRDGPKFKGEALASLFRAQHRPRVKA
jgi:integrase